MRRSEGVPRFGGRSPRFREQLGAGSGVPDIFLSYKPRGSGQSWYGWQAFEREGLKVWWDVGLTPGEAYDRVTGRALKKAKAVVVLWSKKSVESRWVRAEATLADRNKTLVPCMTAHAEISALIASRQNVSGADISPAAR